MNTKKNTEAGFTYVDVMIAVVILLVGILALFAAVTGAVFQAKGQEEQLEARQIAASTMESVMAVKENKETDKNSSVMLGWDAIGNKNTNFVNGAYRGIFVAGFQPVYDSSGKDEIIGTEDDVNGADGIAGTADDGKVVQGVQRRIAIADECDTERPSANCTTPGNFPVMVRSVVVTVNYYVGSVQRQEQITTLLTNYYVTN